MMMHLIRKAKIKFFEPDDAGGTVIHLPVGHLGPDPVAPFAGVRRLTVEQQRIELLEIQNQQLRADIAQWKNSSIGFARDMRKLLND